MRLALSLLLHLLLALVPQPLGAQEAEVTSLYADRQLEDPAAEAEARELMHALRCITCQSQSIADSDAPMAADMRSLVRERIAAGETPDTVREWLVERYGAYVTYEPELDATTWPLFAGPLLILLAVGALAWGRIRRSRIKRARG